MVPACSGCSAEMENEALVSAGSWPLLLLALGEPLVLKPRACPRRSDAPDLPSLEAVQLAVDSSV